MVDDFTRLLDAENIVLSLSGLDQSDLYWVRRLLRALGRHLRIPHSEPRLIMSGRGYSRTELLASFYALALSVRQWRQVRQSFGVANTGGFDGMARLYGTGWCHTRC